MSTDLSFSIDLNNNLVSRASIKAGLAYMTNLGLTLISGTDVADGYAYSLFGNDAYTNGIVNGIEGYAPQTMTTAQYTNLHLTAGSKLVFTYDYIPCELANNDFAFALLADSNGNVTPELLADVNASNAAHSYSWTNHFNINVTGDYKLLLGSADAGDKKGPSVLIVHSISIQVPGGGYTLSGSDITLGDGTSITRDALSPGGSSFVAALKSAAGNGLIGQDGNGLIGQDGNGLIGQDGNGLIGQDGNGLYLPGGAALIGQDGNGLIGQDGNGLIGQDGNGLVGASGSTLVSNSSGTLVQVNANASFVNNLLTTGVVSNDGGTFGSAREYSTLSVADQVPPPTISAVVPDGTTDSGVAPAVSAGGPSAFIMASVSRTTTAGTAGTVTSIVLRFIGTDGSVTGSPVTLATLPRGAFVSALSTSAQGNGFAVAWSTLDYVSGQNVANAYVQFFDAGGAKIGGPVSLASNVPNVYVTPSITALVGGNYLAVVDKPNSDGTKGVAATVYDPSGNVLQTASSPSLGAFLPGATITDPVVTPLFDGSAVIAAEVTFRGQYGYQQETVVTAHLTTTGISGINPVGSVTASTLVREPALATLSNGNVAIVYEDYSQFTSANPFAPLLLQIRDPNGNDLLAAPVSVGTHDGFTHPSITALQNGGFVITWQKGTGTPIVGDPYGAVQITDDQFESRIYDNDGVAQGAAFVSSPGDGTLLQLTHPASAQSRDGTLLVSGVGSTTTSVYAGHETLTFGLSGGGSPELEGRGIDPYIVGATVFADLNGNGMRDAGEASTTTDAQGRFALPGGTTGTLILTGGTDSATGQANTQTFTAPAGSNAITALTTLIQKIAATNGGAVGSALYAVTQAFGLPSGYELTQVDTQSAATYNLPSGQAAYVAAAIVESAVLAAQAQGATGDLYAKLAADITAVPGAFDPTTIAAMQSLGLAGTAANTAASVAAASRTTLLAKLGADASNGAGLVSDVATVLRAIPASASAGGGGGGGIVGDGSSSGNNGGGGVSGGSSGGGTVGITPATIGVYRFFSKVDGTHFFTASASERVTIDASRPDLVDEGVGLSAVDPAAADPNTVAVYRFFDTRFGTHFYTADTTEKDTVIATRSDLTFEGTGFYEHATQAAGDAAVYRFFDNIHGTHFYTGDATERANILQTRPDLIAEGIGFYAPAS